MNPTYRSYYMSIWLKAIDEGMTTPEARELASIMAAEKFYV